MNQLAAARRQQNLTQVELAGLTEYSRSAISTVEVGSAKPWPKFRKAMATALRAPEDQLFPEES